MAMDLATFRITYPEFAPIIDDVYVQAKLDEAQRNLSATAWSDHFNDAHGMQTAHLLWSSPFGATMRLDSGGELKKSRYQTLLQELAADVIDTAVVVTGCARVR